MVGDGSYLMMNSEIATSVMLGHEAHHRRARQSRLRLHQPPAARDRRRELQQPAASTRGTRRCREIDFAAHAASLGAIAEKVAGDRRARGGACARARGDDRTTVIVIDTDPLPSTEAGGHWWDVAVPEVSERAGGRARRARAYEDARELQQVGD